MANIYRYNGFPIIQCGTFTTAPNPSVTKNIIFQEPFRTSTVYVVANAIGNTDYFMVSPYIFNRSSTGFSVRATFKDGRNNQSGGGYYGGPFNYIAMSADFVYYNSVLNSVAYPFIVANNTSSYGSITYPNSLGSTSSFFTATIDADLALQIGAYSVYAESGTGCTTVATFKDATQGNNGGNYYTGGGNYIAIAQNIQTISKYNCNGFPIIQGGDFTTNEPTPTSVGTFTGGTSTVTFEQPFATNNVFVVANANANTTTNLVTISISNITSTGFKAVAFYKNSTSGSLVGGIYGETCNYIAVSIMFGLQFTVYDGYFADNVSWFNTASLLTINGKSSGLTQNISDISGGTRGLIAENTRDGYSVQWIGNFYANVTGTWTFIIGSDDASYLWLGNIALSGYTTANALLNNGGTHSFLEVANTITLTAGTFYPIRIQYGELNGDDAIYVAFVQPGNPLTTDGTNYYFPPNVGQTFA